MLNIFVLGIVSLLFGVSNLFSSQGYETKILVLLGICLVALATFFGMTGDLKLCPTSFGRLLLYALYNAGMLVAYKAGGSDVPSEEEEIAPRQCASSQRASPG